MASGIGAIGHIELTKRGGLTLDGKQLYIRNLKDIQRNNWTFHELVGHWLLNNESVCLKTDHLDRVHNPAARTGLDPSKSYFYPEFLDIFEQIFELFLRKYSKYNRIQHDFGKQTEETRIVIQAKFDRKIGISRAQTQRRGGQITYLQDPNGVHIRTSEDRCQVKSIFRSVLSEGKLPLQNGSDVIWLNVT